MFCFQRHVFETAQLDFVEGLCKLHPTQIQDAKSRYGTNHCDIRLFSPLFWVFFSFQTLVERGMKTPNTLQGLPWEIDRFPNRKLEPSCERRQIISDN
jgi:hypothetical protein